MYADMLCLLVNRKLVRPVPKPPRIPYMKAVLAHGTDWMRLVMPDAIDLSKSKKKRKEIQS